MNCRCGYIYFRPKAIVKSVLLSLLVLSVIGCTSARERESAGIVLVFKHGKIAGDKPRRIDRLDRRTLEEFHDQGHDEAGAGDRSGECGIVFVCAG